MCAMDTENAVETQFFHHQPKNGFPLQNGTTLSEFTLAYESYGELNAERSNVVLLFHAMTGSQHAAGYNPQVEAATHYWTKECHYGWWDSFIGPERALNTDLFCVICINYLGSCYGSTGPESINPATATPYGRDFPNVTISDVVDSQLLLLKHLGIERLRAVIGASTGGLLALDLAVRYPTKVDVVIPIAAGMNTETLQRLYIFEQICAIENCPSDSGLMLARMIAHKTFVSLHTIKERAQGKVRLPAPEFVFHTMDNAEESYMHHQGRKFTARFSRYSYLLILEMWMRFNLQAKSDSPTLQELFSKCRQQRYLIFSISSDVCFYPEQQDRLYKLLKEVNVPVTYLTVHSDRGHDSFLLEPELYTPSLRHVLESKQ